MGSVKQIKEGEREREGEKRERDGERGKGRGRERERERERKRENLYFIWICELFGSSDNRMMCVFSHFLFCCVLVSVFGFFTH